MKFAIVLAVVMATFNVAAAQQRDKLTGHGNAKFGMTYEQVIDAYPDVTPYTSPDARPGIHRDRLSRYSRIADTRVSITYYFSPSKRLNSIMIFFRDYYGVGPETCQTSLFEKWYSEIQRSYGRATSPKSTIILNERETMLSATWTYRDGSEISLSTSSYSDSCILSAHYTGPKGVRDNF
jgi:hypothetical protein